MTRHYENRINLNPSIRAQLRRLHLEDIPRCQAFLEWYRTRTPLEQRTIEDDVASIIYAIRQRLKENAYGIGVTGAIEILSVILAIEKGWLEVVKV